MISSRSSFGCTVNVHTNQIYVAGGQTNGVQTKKCEVYDILSNNWRELPDLNEAKSAASLCILSGRWLYCMGGFSKPDSGSPATLLTSIEILDLWSPAAKW